MTDDDFSFKSTGDYSLPGSDYSLPRSDQSYVYSPQPDITTYELAKILPITLQGRLTEEGYKELGSAARHLKRMGV